MSGPTHVHVASGNDVARNLEYKRLELERDFWRDAHRRTTDLFSVIVNGVDKKGLVVLHIDGLTIKLVSVE